MNRFEKSLVLVAATMMSGQGTALAAEETDGDVKAAQDLTAVLALQSKPCGQVVSAVQQSEDNYVATCQNGNRYRIFVNADGRVIVEKLG